MGYRSQLRFLRIYSGLLTLSFAATVYLGVRHSEMHSGNNAEFDQLTVHRIDVVEPNGTPRLFISDRSEFPGEFYHGRESTREARSDSAGMLFINDEGTEDGGLIYGGAKENGRASSFSHLSFDQYEQDQTIVIGTSLSNGERQAAIQLNDAPEVPITPALIAEGEQIKLMPHGASRGAAWAAYQKRYPALTERAALGRNGDGSVGLVFRDKEGRSRLEMTVGPDGKPSVNLLDEHGKIVKRISIN